MQTWYLNASLANCSELMLQHVDELSLGDAVAVHDDAVRLEPARALVEHDQQLLHHAAHLVHYLLSVNATVATAHYHNYNVTDKNHTKIYL